ncbi:uncharacterized protein BYT42DRAFT_317055 [Radiomyces spectabilis]|uniref:uncharacterized protein n=1 Tax=Radiomyces spectabilis TaxID=64574 RepID=UPI002220C94B|nr:uncharacterized protein BYT42DRAFT_317055 [Radiomyces spectabilis]KAI8379186.1 hypothetical protein BYT42DRAFT_317055 [Radiomyces spectabilis]
MKNTKKALRILLRRFDIKPDHSLSLASDVARLLNDRKNPLYNFDITSKRDEPFIVTIIESHLTLLAISLQINVKVFLFSSRSHTRVFGNRDCWIGILHNVSSFTGESTFIPLGPQQNRVRKSTPMLSVTTGLHSHLPVARVRSTTSRKGQMPAVVLSSEYCLKILTTFFVTYLKSRVTHALAKKNKKASNQK